MWVVGGGVGECVGVGVGVGVWVGVCVGVGVVVGVCVGVGVGVADGVGEPLPRGDPIAGQVNWIETEFRLAKYARTGRASLASVVPSQFVSPAIAQPGCDNPAADRSIPNRSSTSICPLQSVRRCRSCARGRYPLSFCCFGATVCLPRNAPE
jgi:hypothetical protein